MPNYQNGKIYKLTSFQTDKIYIGSTCQSLAVRKAGHVSNYKRILIKKNGSISSLEILKYEDVKIILLENYPCESKEQLLARERYYIENTANCVNKIIPTRTQKEYREDNKEKLQELNKEWRKKNHDKVRQDKQEYYEKNKERIKEKNKQVIICEYCKIEVKICKKARHNKTQKHLRNSELLDAK
jgi:hypothetical protein